MAFNIVQNNKKQTTTLPDWIDLFEALSGIDKTIKLSRKVKIKAPRRGIADWIK